MSDRERWYKEALERIVKDAPVDEPERIITDNYDDTFNNGYDSAHWYYARIAREALKD